MQTEGKKFKTLLTKEEVEKFTKQEFKTFLLKVDLRETPNPDNQDYEEGEEDIYYCILKKPGRREMSHAMNAGSNPLDMAERIIINCWLAGDMEIREISREDDLGLPAQLKAAEIIELGQASLKKLSTLSPKQALTIVV
jgi:hypothetical protein